MMKPRRIGETLGETELFLAADASPANALDERDSGTARENL